MQDIDPLNGDQLLDRAGIGAQPEWIEGIGGERNPFRPGCGQLIDERAALGRDQRAGAKLQQNPRDIDGGAGDRLLAQRGHDLQYRRAGERAGRDTLFEDLAHASVPIRKWASTPPLAGERERSNGTLAFAGDMRRNTAMGEYPIKSMHPH